jgi:hypothetical protein
MKKYLSVWLERIALGLIVILLLKAWFFGSFIDEQENMTVGWLLSQGLVIYRDFFAHHTPLPYFISSIFFLVGQPPWWVWRLATLGFCLGTGAMVWLKTDRRMKPAILLTGILLSLAVPKLNLQMFLADSFFAYSFLGSLILVISYWRYQLPKFSWTLKWLLFFMFVSGWSTIVALPPFLLLLVGLTWKAWQHSGRSWQPIWSRVKQPMLWFLFSCGIFPLYFAVNGALADFWWSAVIYNQQVYFSTRLAETAAELKWGPFYYAFNRFFHLLISQGQFIWQTVLTFLLTFKGLLFSLGSISQSELWLLVKVWLISPVSALSADVLTVLALGCWAVVLTLLWQKKWLILAAFLLTSGLLYIRNNEIFHLAVLWLLVFWSVSFLLVNAWRRGQRALIFLLGLFLLVAISYFCQSYAEHTRNKTSMISQQQIELARKINQFTRPGDRIQIVGGGLTYYWLADRLPANKMIIYYPWFQPVTSLRQDLITTIATQRARAVILEEEFDLEVVEAIKNNYVAIQGIYLPLVNKGSQP